MVLGYIILATVVISLIAFIGALTLFFEEKILSKILLYLVALAAGGLLGGAFLHLLPEAVERVGAELNLFIYLLLGFFVFFILEQYLLWHHHHEIKHLKLKKPMTYLILISDAIHNFIDGLVIAASFVINIPLGIATSIAIALHEIPQEIGDFGVLVYGGFSRGKALLFNFFSALTAILGGIVGFFLAGGIGGAIIYLLPFAAGNFIYIAVSDLIPELRKEAAKRKSLGYLLVFLIGILLMFLVKLI
jgi:zinc and cadmium transporter